MEHLLTGTGVLCVLYGLIGLAGVWLFPSIGRSKLYGLGMLTGRMEPTRANRSLMCLWALFFGAYVAASHSGYRTLGYVFFGVFLACAISGIFIRYKHGREV